MHAVFAGPVDSGEMLRLALQARYLHSGSLSVKTISVLSPLLVFARSHEPDQSRLRYRPRDAAAQLNTKTVATGGASPTVPSEEGDDKTTQRPLLLATGDEFFTLGGGESSQISSTRARFQVFSPTQEIDSGPPEGAATCGMLYVN